MPRKARGAKRCDAVLDKETGRRCRRWAEAGKIRCWQCGQGSSKRVREGKKKPAGRQVGSGLHADPDKPKETRLTELIEQFRNDPKIHDATESLIMVKAALHWQLEKIEGGTFSAWKSLGLPEDPATWLIQQGKLVIEATAKACSLTYKDKVRAACTILEPALKVVQDVIYERIVDEGLRGSICDAIQAGLAQLLVPAGGGSEG